MRQIAQMTIGLRQRHGLVLNSRHLIALSIRYAALAQKDAAGYACPANVWPVLRRAEVLICLGLSEGAPHFLHPTTSHDQSRTVLQEVCRENGAQKGKLAGAAPLAASRWC